MELFDALCDTNLAPALKTLDLSETETDGDSAAWASRAVMGSLEAMADIRFMHGFGSRGQNLGRVDGGGLPWFEACG